LWGNWTDAASRLPASFQPAAKQAAAKTQSLLRNLSSAGVGETPVLAQVSS
jgi:hypothetical protein